MRERRYAIRRAIVFRHRRHGRLIALALPPAAGVAVGFALWGFPPSWADASCVLLAGTCCFAALINGLAAYPIQACAVLAYQRRRVSRVAR